MGTTQAEVQGFDISHYQPNVNFRGAYSAGARFVIIKVKPISPVPETRLPTLPFFPFSPLFQ